MWAITIPQIIFIVLLSSALASPWVANAPWLRPIHRPILAAFYAALMYGYVVTINYGNSL